MAPKNIQSWRPDLSGKVHPAAVSAINLLFDAIQDHDTAIVAVNNKVGTTPTATVTTTAVPSTSTTPTPTPTPPAPPPTPSSFPNLGTVNVQAGTVYATQLTDNGGLLVVGNSSPVAVLLTATVAVPWFMSVVNLGSSNAVFTPSVGNINNVSNLTLRPNGGAFIYFDGTSFWAPFMPTVPATKAVVAHQWLQSYDATTGLFTQTQPAYSDLSGPILFQTNTANNGSQVKLNLIGGTNVTVTDGGSGNITISASTTTTTAYVVRIKTTNYTAVANDAVFMDTSGGGHTVTLPAASANAGVSILVKKTSFDGNNLTVAPTGGDLIDTAGSQVTSLPLVSYTFVSDGVSNWWII